MTLRVELFCEDGAHESCARALVARIARESDVNASVHTATASGGVGRLKRELRAYQATVARRPGTPDLLVVLADANAVGPNVRRAEIEETLDYSVFPRAVIGTPDPCVERWLLADEASFRKRFEAQTHTGGQVRSGGWKKRLVEALKGADVIVMHGGAEFADEIVEAMDLYRAGRADPTIKAFSDDLRRELRQLKTAA